MHRGPLWNKSNAATISFTNDHGHSSRYSNPVADLISHKRAVSRVSRGISCRSAGRLVDVDRVRRVAKGRSWAEVRWVAEARRGNFLPSVFTRISLAVALLCVLSPSMRSHLVSQFQPPLTPCSLCLMRLGLYLCSYAARPV